MRWLTPRLGEFFREHPEVGLRVYGEFHALDRARMVRDGIDAGVRFDWRLRRPQGQCLLEEWLLPVASPPSLPRTRGCALAARHGGRLAAA